MNQNDDKWAYLFDKYNILEHIKNEGVAIITASQIKECREPRLMTKFDSKGNRPTIFKDNNLSILPRTRGEYVISSFAAYAELKEIEDTPRQVAIPEHIQSLTLDGLINESIALNCAYVCGILKDFLEEDDLLPTVSGRMGTGNFSFRINKQGGSCEIAVQRAQIEIDAAYEGLNSLILLEAKRALPEDFIVRQLYYPFRVWEKKVSKPVKPIFMSFSNGLFRLYQYCFTDVMNYNSFSLVKQGSYMIMTEIRLADLEYILKNVHIVEEPDLPFPQADKLSRVVSLMELLIDGEMTKQEITSQYAFDERQADYYASAGRYLGFIGKIEDSTFCLTPEGEKVMRLGYRERQLEIAKKVLAHRVFNKVMELHLYRGKMPDRAEIVQIMKSAGLHNVGSDSTYDRRASTVSGWVNWILTLVDSNG